MCAMTDKGEIYSWGRGEYVWFPFVCDLYGTLTTTNTKDELVPKKSDFPSVYGKVVDVVLFLRLHRRSSVATQAA